MAHREQAAPLGLPVGSLGCVQRTEHLHSQRNYNRTLRVTGTGKCRSVQGCIPQHASTAPSFRCCCLTVRRLHLIPHRNWVGETRAMHGFAGAIGHVACLQLIIRVLPDTFPAPSSDWRRPSAQWPWTTGRPRPRERWPPRQTRPRAPSVARLGNSRTFCASCHPICLHPSSCRYRARARYLAHGRR